MTEEEGSVWNKYVLNQPNSTFFHLWEWRRVINRAFGHPTYYFAAYDNSKIVGVLPLVHVKSLLFGNALISLPFCVYGGLLADELAIENKLTNRALELAKDLGVGWIELRHTKPKNTDWYKNSLYVTFKKKLDPDIDNNLQAVPRKQRRMIRVGIKNGLESEEEKNVDTLYTVYSESVRNLGTPVISKRYLEILKEEFGEACRVLIVRDSNKHLVSGVMSFYFKDQVLPYYGGGKNLARNLNANDFMYWELMRRSVEEGIRIFDFGRSKYESGSYRFKTHWGFNPTPLNYETKLIRASTVPEINPTNPKYQFFIRAWKSLPLPIANSIGPLLAKYLG